MSHWFTKFFSVNSAFKMNNGRLRPKVRKELYILRCTSISRKPNESIGLMEKSASFLPASKQFCLEMVIWEKMFVKWIQFLLAGVAMFSPFHMQMITQAIHLVQPGLRAAMLLKLLWCSSAIKTATQVTDHASQLCLSALEYSALLSPDFYCGLTMFFLVWFGVFVGFVFPNSECKQDANESKNSLHLHTWWDRKKFKSFYSVNIRANTTLLLLQCLKCFSFLETRK